MDPEPTVAAALLLTASSRPARLCSPHGNSTAPSTNHNQPRMNYSLLPLGKSRRARPDVAFRGRVGGGWGAGRKWSRESRRARPDVAFRGRVGGGWGAGRKWSRASVRSNADRRRAAGAQRARSMAPTRACSRRRRRPRPRGRGPCPRTAGGRSHRVDAFVAGWWGGAESATTVVAHLFLEGIAEVLLDLLRILAGL